MTEPELLEHLEKNRPKRKARLRDALRDGARRTARPLRSAGDRCAICTLPEDGGGLCVFELRDGQELLTGHRCAEYLDYLISHPEYARGY